MALNIDYDLDRWLYAPARFPWESFRDEEHWADVVAKEFGGSGRRRAPKQRVSWLRDYLVGAVRSNHAGTIRFLHLPHIDAPLSIVDVYDMPTHPDRPLSDLTHEDQGPAIRLPELVPFESPHLGTGIKSTRWVTNDAGTIIRATNWVWRTGGRDIVVLTGTNDLPLAEALDPVIDELARSISIAAE